MSGWIATASFILALILGIKEFVTHFLLNPNSL